MVRGDCIFLNNEELPDNPKHFSPLTLAFLGDAVFELLVRERLIIKGNMPAGKLHNLTVGYVKASSQSRAMDSLLEKLQEDEVAIFKRGRNTNGTHVPKNANPIDYRRATGLEALFGYLYLSGNLSRIQELFDIIWQESVPEEA